MKQTTDADKAQTQVNTLADVSVGDMVRVNHRNETETVVEVTDSQITTELNDGFERTHTLYKTNDEMTADDGAAFKLPGNTDRRHFLTVVSTDDGSKDETATVERVEETETGAVRFTVSLLGTDYEKSYVAEQHDDIHGAYKLVVSPADVGETLHETMEQLAEPFGVETIDTA